MLSHKITDGKTTKTVSEFAWGRKYSKLEKWKIVDTKGKAMGTAQPPALPPTQFQPPAQVVQLRGQSPVVEESGPHSDPIGAIRSDLEVVGAEKAVITENGVSEVVERITAEKKKGRPVGSKNKAKATV